MIFWHMIDIDEDVSETWCVPPEGFIEQIEEVKKKKNQILKKIYIRNTNKI